MEFTTKSENFAEVVTGSIDSAVKYIAFLLNARACRLLPVSGETSLEFEQRLMRKNENIKYYEDSARAILKGVSVEGLRMLENFQSNQEMNYLLLQTHGPDLIG